MRSFFKFDTAPAANFAFALRSFKGAGLVATVVEDHERDLRARETQRERRREREGSLKQGERIGGERGNCNPYGVGSVNSVPGRGGEAMDNPSIKLERTNRLANSILALLLWHPL